MNKYLKRKYRELKMYVKNGWWGYARPAPRSGRQDANMSEGMKLLSRRFVLLHLPLVASCPTPTVFSLKNAHGPSSVRVCAGLFHLMAAVKIVSVL